MNVYSCFYQGNLGYVCRTRSTRWMFVPELGQPDGTVYRNVSIDDLVFRNPRDRAFELVRETSLKHFSLRRFINWLCGLEPRPRTLGGLLFAPGRI